MKFIAGREKHGGEPNDAKDQPDPVLKVFPPRSARQSRPARIAYSLSVASFRITA